MEHAVATRAARMVRRGRGDEPTGLAPDGAGHWDAVGAGQGVGPVLAVEPFPHLFAIERAVEPAQHESQRQQRIDAGLQPDVDEATQLDIGHEHAEHEDLDHRPWAQLLGQREDAAQMGGRI